MNEQPNQNNNQAPAYNTAAPAKSSNTALIIVIIIIVVVFFLFIGGIFLFSMFVFSLADDMDVNGKLPDSSINIELPEVDDEPEEEDDASSIVAGTWDCYNFDGAPKVEDGFESTLKLTRGGSYVFGEYGNEDVNHFKGTYEALDLKKQNASGSYNYYSLDFTTDEFVLNGEESNTQLSDAEVGITEADDGREMILAFESTDNMYYCIER